MYDPDVDPDLRDVSERVADLSRQISIDLRYKAHLREALLRRHQELSAEVTQRAARKLWPRLTGVKRLTLVAPPALAAAVAAWAMIWALQVSGHRSPQLAEAQRISAALVRAVPTVTSWKVTAHQQGQNVSSVTTFGVQLTPDQEIYIRAERGTYRSYFYSGGQWSEVRDGQSIAPSGVAWQFAFATLPQRLASHRFVLLTSSQPNTEGIRYSLPERHGIRIQVTAWIDRTTGLAKRLERDVIRGNRVIERDWADYRYERAK